MPNATLYFDTAMDSLVDSSGYALAAGTEPRLIFSERPAWSLTLKSGASPLDLSSCASFGFSVDTDWDSETIAGALTAAKSGAVTAITADGFPSAPPEAGVLHLTNQSGDTEAVGYSSYTVNSGTYTFVVSSTLTYSYAENDYCYAEDTAPMVRLTNSDIDSSSKATGILTFDIPTDNNVFLNTVQGQSDWVSCVGELRGYNAQGILTIVAQFTVYARGLVDPNTGSLTGPVSNYYTKAAVDAIFTTYNPYSLDFTHSSLTAGTLSVTHGKSSLNPVVTIKDNNGIQVGNATVTITGANTLTVDMSPWGVFAGTYNIMVRK